MSKAKVEEYKDARGDNRIRVTAQNGNKTYGSTEGYKNKQDMRTTAVNTSLDLLDNYADILTEEQKDRFFEIAGKIVG